MNKKILLGAVAVFSLTTLLWSCEDADDGSVVFERTSINCENEYLGLNTRVKGDAHGGNYFSRMDSISTFGYGQSFYIPDSLLNQNFVINLSGWMRSGVINSDASIAITINTGDSMLSWNSVFLKDRISSVNQWINFTEEVMISKNLTNAPNLTIKIFGYYQGGKSTFDIDDLNISLKTME